LSNKGEIISFSDKGKFSLSDKGEIISLLDKGKFSLGMPWKKLVRKTLPNSLSRAPEKDLSTFANQAVTLMKGGPNHPFSINTKT